MNRQVGPSILLSVLIVCFFAVALYQRDPPRSAHGRARPSLIVALRLPPVSAPQRADLWGQGESAERVQPASLRREHQAQPIALASGSSISVMQPIRANSSRPRSRDSVESDGSQKGERIEVARQPGSPFTIALANETLQDVALRVYGSTAAVNSLWRANRDALSRSDLPLSAGTVLRTPAVR